MTTAAGRFAPDTRQRWRGVVALNLVSTFSQIGQYGIGFSLYPLALEARGLPAWQIGVISSALWLGMLAGLLLAPMAVRRLHHSRTVLVGVVLSALALMLTPALPVTWWAVPAAACGFGMGFRWIGNETWLFGIMPEEGRGRIVGFHETLIAIAAVAGPALIAVLGATGWPSFLAGGLLSLAAALPLQAAGSVQLGDEAVPAPTLRAGMSWAVLLRRFITLGAILAGIGGITEGAILGVFPVYARERGFDSSEAAWLLSVFGMGSLFLQFLLGWIVDTWGMRTAATCAAVVTAACALIASVAAPAGQVFTVLMFLMGGGITGFLTLGLIAATEHADPARLAEDVSRVSIVFTLLSAIGPVLVGGLASLAGGTMLMVFACITSVVLLATLKLFR